MRAARSWLARHSSRAQRSEQGFTIVEMVVAVGLMALVLAALASVLGASLRSLAVSKARSQANDVVTQGIEDLHRLPFNSLGECAPPTPAPAGLSNAVLLPNCGSSVPYEDPCNGLTGTVPLESYTCTKNGIGYQVKRYVAWADAGQTTKRLAVFATWTDAVGNHSVSQQSSLRSPDQASITGLAPPTFSVGGPTVTPLNVAIDGAGHMTSAGLTLSAATSNLNTAASTTLASAIASHSIGDQFNITVSSASGFPAYDGWPVVVDNETFTVEAGSGTTTWRVLATSTGAAHSSGATVRFAGDRVYASFNSLAAGGTPQTSTVVLASSDGANWTYTITPADGFTYGSGTQYFAFSVLRASDGKVASANPSSAVCFSTGGACSGGTLPTVAVSSVPSTASITTTGSLAADLQLKVSTTNVTSADTVTATFPTQAGAVTLGLNPDPLSPACPPPSSATPGVTCSWVGTIHQNSGYKFAPGTQSFYFAVAQTATAGTIDAGSTRVAAPYGVTFS